MKKGIKKIGFEFEGVRHNGYGKYDALMYGLYGANLAKLAQAAYDQGGMDLLRLLDAKRARLDADLAWVHAMADWQVSGADLKFAAGEIK